MSSLDPNLRIFIPYEESGFYRFMFLAHLFLLGRLVHLGLQEINELGLLRDSALHFNLFMGIENLGSAKGVERKASFRGGDRHSLKTSR